MTADLDLSTPQAQAARLFMQQKGVDVEPVDIEKLDGQPCWYMLYKLPEGQLELEVYWNAGTAEWETMVTTFALAG